MTGRIKVAILGSGNIGTDLLMKTLRSKFLECTRFIGRNLNSKGMVKGKEVGVLLSDKGIDEIVENPGCCQLIFDATSARDHLYHWSLLKDTDKIVVDMTPSKIGKMIVPAINLNDALEHRNVNMISCGGQASIPLVHTLTQACDGVEYIEIVSSIASASAGAGTRVNIDEYIENTEEALRFFSKCNNVKVILILNPAVPSIDMQTTISAKMPKPDMRKLSAAIAKMEKSIQAYVPGYLIVVPPVYENNRVVIMVRVRGLGDYLPGYAGNLDIINCAAIATAEKYAQGKQSNRFNLAEIKS